MKLDVLGDETLERAVADDPGDVLEFVVQDVAQAREVHAGVDAQPLLAACTLGEPACERRCVWIGAAEAARCLLDRRWLCDEPEEAFLKLGEPTRHGRSPHVPLQPLAEPPRSAPRTPATGRP